MKAKGTSPIPGPAEADEIRLVNGIAAGDRTAFETLYRRYFPKLIRFLDRMTRRPNLIEEIVNDTMLIVWQKAHTFHPTCKVSTWIFGIAYRKALKAIRGIDEPLECDFDACEGDAGHEPENEARHHELHEILTQALDMLSPEHRAVVCLTYYHGLDYAEIADIMGCPVNTVKSRMFHARRRLESLLSGRMEDRR